ncbi:hypothetical protein EG329_000175 [Mollisiaceae sp. DMI_Dod_QoI]|nr:hypothetical protein EG329_000175 [Helotiales sp. DMI_Dod_QoI]
MAQNNPVNEAASYSSTGGANAPLNTGTTYGNTNTGPTTTHHAANTTAPGAGTAPGTGPAPGTHPTHNPIHNTANPNTNTNTNTAVPGTAVNQTQPTTTHTTAPSTTHTTSTTTTSNSNPHSKLTAAKNLVAGIHGAGEKIRGEFNTAVDDTFNERGGVEKNRRVANAGDAELATGEFAHSTKNREGAVPGADHGRRF